MLVFLVNPFWRNHTEERVTDFSCRLFSHESLPASKILSSVRSVLSIQLFKVFGNWFMFLVSFQPVFIFPPVVAKCSKGDAVFSEWGKMEGQSWSGPGLPVGCTQGNTMRTNIRPRLIKQSVSGSRKVWCVLYPFLALSLGMLKVLSDYLSVLLCRITYVCVPVSDGKFNSEEDILGWKGILFTYTAFIFFWFQQAMNQTSCIVGWRAMLFLIIYSAPPPCWNLGYFNMDIHCFSVQWTIHLQSFQIYTFNQTVNNPRA